MREKGVNDTFLLFYFEITGFFIYLQKNKTNTMEKENKDALERLREKIKKCGKEVIIEMAIPRNMYIERVGAIFPQIIRHWCLIHYFTLIQKTENKQHWQGELMGFFSNISKIAIKDNKENNRKQALEQAINQYNFRIRETINKINVKKFKDEGIDIVNNAFYNYTIIDFLNELDKIIDLIAKRNTNEIREYIKNL